MIGALQTSKQNSQTPNRELSLVKVRLVKCAAQSILVLSMIKIS